MNILDDIKFTLDIDLLVKKNHIKNGSGYEDEFRTLAAGAGKIGKPKILYRECFIEEKGPDSVLLDGIEFRSHVLRRKLDKVERVFPYVITCGREVEEAGIPQGDFLGKYWMDTIKHSILISAVGFFKKHITEKYKIGKTASMNPGSGDADVWPIQQQKELFSLLGDVEGSIGVELTDSCLMKPSKTVSGILFPSEVDFRTCQLCHREDCPGRSAPFDQALWDSMESDK